MSLLSPSTQCLDQALAVDPRDGVPRGREGTRSADDLFAHPRVDRALTRCHPLVPFAVYLPVVVWLNAVPPASHSARDGLARLASFALGWLTWTLAEYLLHRFALHLPGHGPAARVARFVMHGHHHATPGARDRLVAMPFQSAMMFALLWAVLARVPHARVALSGAVIGYLYYELAHFHAHHGHARALRGLQRHHLRHHHDDPKRGFGISTTLWDRVFRTLHAAKRGTA